MRHNRVHQLAEIAAGMWYVTAADIIGPSRRAQYLPPRFAVVVAAMQLPSAPSSVQIGRALSGRDHSSILHARDRGLEMASSCPTYAARLARLINLAGTLKVAAAVKPEPPKLAPVPEGTVPRLKVVKSKRLYESQVQRDDYEDDEDVGNAFFADIRHGSALLAAKLREARAA